MINNKIKSLSFLPKLAVDEEELISEGVVVLSKK
jgi:hypothetical protein